MVLVNMNLSTCIEKFLSDALTVDFKFHYIMALENASSLRSFTAVYADRNWFVKQLQLVNISLKANGQQKAQSQADVGADFVALSTRSDVPANCFVVVDSHADTHTGGLQWAGGKTAPQMAATSEIVREFCGQRFITEMARSSHAARSVSPPEKSRWYDASPPLRGGWRGLFIASCGPVVRVRSAFEDLRELVQR